MNIAALTMLAALVIAMGIWIVDLRNKLDKAWDANVLLKVERERNMRDWYKTEERLIEQVTQLRDEISLLNKGYKALVYTHIEEMRDKDKLIQRLNDDLAGRGPEHLPTWLDMGEPNESWNMNDTEFDEWLSRQPNKTVEEMARIISEKLGGTEGFEEFPTFEEPILPE
ncbi:MAG: hypothetical protein AMS18_00470 [Gemmatimonas sp. SG8_17]|nr:MAG: hypothetical protein AMS18_00470 [Gemmatimonas sp. SG8_17]